MKWKAGLAKTFKEFLPSCCAIVWSKAFGLKGRGKDTRNCERSVLLGEYAVDFAHQAMDFAIPLIIRSPYRQKTIWIPFVYDPANDLSRFDDLKLDLFTIAHPGNRTLFQPITVNEFSGRPDDEDSMATRGWRHAMMFPCDSLHSLAVDWLAGLLLLSCALTAAWQGYPVQRPSAESAILNHLRDEINANYGYNSTTPRVNCGPCIRFAIAFRD